MIFTTVDSLVEQVGRTRARNWGELDTLHCLWNGPTSLADTAPKLGATHPIYTNMEVNAQRKIGDVAGITRIELDYVGLFDGGTIGPVLRGTSVSEGEIEYQDEWSYLTDVENIGTPSNPGIQRTYRYGTNSYVVHYSSLNSNFRYVARNPTAPRFGNNPQASILTNFTRFAGQSVAGTVTLVNQLIDLFALLGRGPFGFPSLDVYCSGFSTEPISPNWYRCSETWSARYIT